jgi:hypothetical protein
VLKAKGEVFCVQPNTTKCSLPGFNFCLVEEHFLLFHHTAASLEHVVN